MPTTIERLKQKTLKFRKADAKHARVTIRPVPKAKTNVPGSTSDALNIRDQIAKLQAQLEALKVTDAPKVILPELHDEKTGRIDAQKVAEFMGVALKPLAEGLGLNSDLTIRPQNGRNDEQVRFPV